MSEGFDIGGIGRGNDVARTVTRAAPAAGQARRGDERPSWVGAVRETSVEPPARPSPASSPAADPVALDAARDSIAAALDATGTKPGPTPIPLAPGASEDAVAAAQVIARLIAANARPALAQQARLAPHAVLAAIDPAE